MRVDTAIYNQTTHQFRSDELSELSLTIFEHPSTDFASGHAFGYYAYVDGDLIDTHRGFETEGEAGIYAVTAYQNTQRK